MPNWGQILQEVKESAQKRHPHGPDLDGIRLKYIKALQAVSDRPVISYATGWLQRRNEQTSYAVEGSDVHGFMECCYEVRERTLDLILHSPGGSAQAAEQILEYLRTRFDYIRAIVPLQAKSAATMIALGCDEILMGNHSELGPIDPQILVPVPEGRRYAPAHAIIRDFKRAKEECKEDVSNIAAWTPILRSYAGGLIEFCHQQVQLSIEVVANWLERYMLRHDDMGVPEVERKSKAKEIAGWFGSEASYDRFRTHGRPIRVPELQSNGIRVRRLEENEALQDAVLSILHILHINEITFNGPAAKLIENHLGRRYVIVEHNVVLQTGSPRGQPPPQQPAPHLSRQQRRLLERKRR